MTLTANQRRINGEIQPQETGAGWSTILHPWRPDDL